MTTILGKNGFKQRGDRSEPGDATQEDGWGFADSFNRSLHANYLHAACHRHLMADEENCPCGIAAHAFFFD